MTERQPFVGDAEGTGPGPISLPGGPSPGAGRGPRGPGPGRADRLEQAALSTEPPRRVGVAAIALGAILPGAGHILAGAWGRGGLILLGWGSLLGTAWLGRTRIVGIGAGALDDRVAVGVLALCLVLLWGGALRELIRARRRRVSGLAGAVAERGDSQWAIAARHFRRNHLAVTGLAVVLLLYLVALLAPLLAPYSPIRQENLVSTSYLAPSPEHWLGTDLFGRDVLSRILYGARISLAIGFIAVAISISLGTLLGAVAGFFGRWVDGLLMRFTDLVLAFPRLVLLILIMALFQPSIFLIILVLGLTQWPGTARLVRGEVLALREREFIQAARALGLGRARIIFRHLVPNVLAPVIVAATLGIGNTIVLEAGLSFLGLGVQPPTASWGNMVADGRQNLIGAWWVATFPGLVIVLTVLAFNLAGDGLRDALDPRLRD